MNKIIIFFLSFFFYSCTQDSTKTTFDLGDYIYVPVKIKGKEYKFIFDTGTTLTVLSHDLVKELGISGQWKDGVKIHSSEAKGIATSFRYEDMLFDIGGLSVKGDFTSDASEKRNLLGMNVISQFHWLLNFRDSTAIVAKDSIQVDETDLTLTKLAYTSEDNCIVSVNINDTLRYNFIFDTGYARSTDTNDCCRPDMEFYQGSEELTQTWIAKEKNSLYFELPNGQKAFIFPTFTLNNITLDYMFMLLALQPHHDYSAKKLNVHGVFTLPFAIERCSLLQINPASKTLSLYAAPNEGAWREKKIKRVHEVLIEQYYRNQERKSEKP